MNSDKVYEIGMDYPTIELAYMNSPVLQRVGSLQEVKSIFFEAFNARYDVDESKFAASNDWSEYEELLVLPIK